MSRSKYKSPQKVATVLHTSNGIETWTLWAIYPSINYCMGQLPVESARAQFARKISQCMIEAAIPASPRSAQRFSQAASTFLRSGSAFISLLLYPTSVRSLARSRPHSGACCFCSSALSGVFLESFLAFSFLVLAGSCFSLSLFIRFTIRRPCNPLEIFQLGLRAEACRSFQLSLLAFRCSLLLVVLASEQGSCGFQGISARVSISFYFSAVGRTPQLQPDQKASCPSMPD